MDMSLKNPATTLWRLSQDGHVLTYAATPHQLGVQLHVSYDGTLLWSEIFPSDVALLERAVKGRSRLESRGWLLCPDPELPN